MPRLNRAVALTAAVVGVLALSACEGHTAEQSKEHSSIQGASSTTGVIELQNAQLAVLGDGDVTLSLTIVNNGTTADSLVSAQVTGASTVTLPTIPGQEPAADGSDAITVPANNVLSLNNGTEVLTVSGLSTVPGVGDTLATTFDFTNAGDVSVEVPVVSSLIESPAASPNPAVTAANLDPGSSATPAD